LEASLSEYERGDDAVGALDATTNLTLVYGFQGEVALALSLLRDSVSTLQTLGNRTALLPQIAGLGLAAAFLVDEESLPIAWELSEEAENLARESNDKRSLAWALDSQAICHYYRGEYQAARRPLEVGIALFEELGEEWGVSQLVWLLGNVAWREGDLAEARRLGHRSITIQPRQNIRQGLPPMLESAAYLALAERELERAARFLSLAERLRQENGMHAQPLLLAERESQLQALRALLPEPEFQAAWKAGRAMTTEAAIAEVLQEN
jgi:tetratricopeptide (TPR) repeat protein